MNNAIFNVKEYEAVHGPIETWDCDVYEEEIRQQKRAIRFRKGKLREQQVLGKQILLLAGFTGAFSHIVPETYIIALLLIFLGCSLLFARKVVIV